MTANSDAYDRLRAGIVAAQLGFNDAVQNGGDGRPFLDLIFLYDSELDAMVAADLMMSSAQYKVLTKKLKDSKQKIEDIIDDIRKLVKSSEVALKIATIFSKIIAII